MTKRADASVFSASPSRPSSSALTPPPPVALPLPPPAPPLPAASSPFSSPASSRLALPAPTTTLPSSLDRYRPGPGRVASRVSGKMRRKARRVPMAGAGRSEGRAVRRRWVSSRRVQVGQV